ncbi:MAG: RND transporter [Deltaproteobacteria bacterium]|nr:MAG: RND transporter [Deltaproteobacteria bacterium]
MFLSDLSIRRPIFAAVMMLALVTLGAFSYKRLAVDMFPDVEIPVVTIVTKFPGASPESVEREVSKKIEEAVNPIAGVKKVLSISRESVSTVMVQFQLEVKLNDGAQEARAKIASIRGELPQGIEEPIIQKLDFAAAPIVSLAVRSDALSPRDLTTLVEKKVKRRFENIPGVGKVALVGSSKREVNVDIDPSRLEALGMGVDEVIAGLTAENVNTPLGRMTRGGAEFPLRVSGKPEAVPAFRTMVIGQRGGRPVTLGEVAAVTDGIEEQRSLALVNGVLAVALDIQKQSGANTVSVVDAVKKEIARLQPELPPGTRIEMVRDASIMIRDSVHDVQTTLVLGGLLTVFIVFCFLNSWRSTVITGLTLPISVISSFIVMNFMGMTLNVMTLMALSLAIGLLIDDAIVVRENIVRHLEHGQDHFEAARFGTSEIGLAVLATTFSIVAVFVPVAFMKGIVGRFFFQFGITVAFAVLVSLFVSFTLDPMLSSRWHDPDIDRSGRRHLVARVLDRFNGWFDRTADRYRAVIGWALGHRMAVLGIAAVAFAGGLFAFASLKTEFFTPVDRAEFQINFKTAPDASLTETRRRVEAVLSQVRSLPEVRSTFATVGAGDAGTVRDGMVYVKLSEKKERARRQDEIQQQVRDRLAAIPGIQPAIVEVGRITGEKPFNVAVRGEDIQLLKKYAAQLKAEVYRIPGIVDLEVTLEQDIPEYRLTVDRERAADLGVTTGNVVRTVGAMVGGQAVTTYEDSDGDAVNVRVRLPASLRENPSQVERLRFAVNRGPEGTALVPMREVARYAMSNTPSEINRQALTREVVLSANLDGLPLGEAMKMVKAVTDRMTMAPGYHVVFTGEGEDMVESFGYMAESLALAVIFVYLILAAQFESFLEPFSIMLSLPLSVVGMAGMLLLTGDTVNIMSLIGLIMLMGLVTKNAILLVDYAKVLQAGGMGRTEAVIAAGRTRLRPIMMTTLAMIFGMLPLALAIGAGAEERAPMARAVIGGLITSTFLTLLVVPVVYTLVDDLGIRLRRRWEGKTAPAGATAAVAILLAGAAAFAPAARAAEPEPGVEMLTLDDAYRIALENHRDIRKALELRNRLEGKYVEERAAALPQLFGSAEGFRSWDATQEVFGVPPSSATADAQLGVSQPLYTGGQVTAAIRAARVGLATADDQVRVARQSALLDVSTAFHDILLARETEAIAVQSRDQKARFLEETRKRNAAGTATDYDVLVAKVDLENAQPAIVRARNQVVTLRERIRFLLGAGGRPVDVRGELAAEIAPWPEYEGQLAKAVEYRPELSDLRHRIGVSEQLLEIARSGSMPRVEARAGAGWKDFRPGGEAGADGKTWSAGLFATWPLFDGMRTRGRVAQAMSDRNTLRIEEAQLLDAIALQVRDAVNAVREAGEVVGAIADTVGQAERLLSLAEKGYEYGVKTKLEVDDAQLNLIQAKGNLARSRRDYRVANAALLRATGTLGEERKASYDAKPPFRPAASPVGIVREVLTGEPALR